MTSVYTTTGADLLVIATDPVNAAAILNLHFCAYKYKRSDIDKAPRDFQTIIAPGYPARCRFHIQQAFFRDQLFITRGF